VVVRQYYEAIAAGDMKAAAALQTANARQAHVGLQGPPSISIKRLEIGPFDAVIADGTRPDHLKAYAEIRETYVTYDLLKDLPAERAGRIGRFVIVARETSTSPWRIDSEGTGP
jgi:redox-regulated HSP33 family molecular chaperone